MKKKGENRDEDHCYPNRYFAPHGLRGPGRLFSLRIKGQSMEPTIPDGSLVAIDHSKKQTSELDGKIVAIRKDNEATIKRLRIVSKKLVLGLPDNPDFMKEAVSLTGEQINNAIIGKVAWWGGAGIDSLR